MSRRRPPVLAILQYRWIGEISAAERERLNNSLRVGVSRFADDFGDEMSRLYDAFLLRNGFPGSPAPLIERYEAWAESAAFPGIVRALYALKTYPDRAPDLFRIDMHSRQMLQTDLPGELQGLRDTAQPSPDELPSTFPAISGMFSLTNPIREPTALIERLLRPFADPVRNTPPPIETPAPIQGWMMIELDRRVFLERVIPALVQKHLLVDQTAYRAALVDLSHNPEVLYSSAGNWTAEDIRTADAAIHIFGENHEIGGGAQLASRAVFPRPRFPKNAIHGEQWMLAVRHRLGSLETAVAQIRRRNLAISFGILATLGAGVVTIAISSLRARNMAKLQMEFAAGVSHEIRTPLAVIRSAAHNLRSGIVSNKEGVERYATIVEDEARRLSSTVDQVLLYSETNSELKQYELTRVDVNEVIDRAVHSLSPAIGADPCDITTHIDPDLPPVRADAAALTQCVQNLLSNALKYGRNGNGAHIEIAATKDSRAGEVRLSITDSGPGIDEADQRHLFRPFYRGAGARSKIPGNGLGLYLVRRIMHAQGGRVTLDSPAHQGACFTLHIPASQ
jgi:signal transduction histidine kinase